MVAVLYAQPASADSFYVNFCPGNTSCPAGVTEASLTFTEVLGTSDPNDYVLALTITGTTPPSPTYIDEVSFSIDGVRTPQDYTSVSLIGDGPTEGRPWIVFFDNVSGSVKSCIKDTNQSQEICTQSGPNTTNYGTHTDGTNVWMYSVDLAPGIAPLSTNSVVNLRAQFLNADGTNAGILSPGGSNLTNTPEPGSLLLLGSGLIALAIGVRRRLAR